MDNPVPPRYWGLYEALLETRNILRALAAARDHSTVIRRRKSRRATDSGGSKTMTQSKQTPRVWSDAIRGSEILSNWVKRGTSAVFLWLTIGIGLGGFAAGLVVLRGHYLARSPTVDPPMLAMPPASVGKSPICRIPMAAQRAFRCPRKRSQGYTARSYHVRRISGLSQ